MENRNVLSVITELPFSFCDRCDMQDYFINVQDLYADGDIYARSVSMRCGNETKCRRFYNMLKGHEGGAVDEAD